jgi:hypothetical protein
MGDDVAFAFPVLEHDRAQAPSEMGVETLELGMLLLVADPEVAKPSSQKQVEPAYTVIERLTPVSWAQSF